MLQRHVRRVWSGYGSCFGETQPGQNTHGETKWAAWHAADFTKKDRLDIYRVQIRPGEHDAVAMSRVGYRDSRHGFWLTNWKFGYGNVKLSDCNTRFYPPVFIAGRWYAIYICNSLQKICIFQFPFRADNLRRWFSPTSLAFKILCHYCLKVYNTERQYE